MSPLNRNNIIQMNKIQQIYENPLTQEAGSFILIVVESNDTQERRKK